MTTRKNRLRTKNLQKRKRKGTSHRRLIAVSRPRR